MGGWFEKCCSEKEMKMMIFDGKNMRKQSEIKKNTVKRIGKYPRYRKTIAKYVITRETP